MTGFVPAVLVERAREPRVEVFGINTAAQQVIRGLLAGIQFACAGT